MWNFGPPISLLSSAIDPGAQIAIETRSGSNDFHGSAFGYVRPRLLNSHDWFAKSMADDFAQRFFEWLGWKLWEVPFGAITLFSSPLSNAPMFTITHFN